MDLVKLFSRKTDGGEKPSGNAQKVKPSKKDAVQPSKAKKPEGTKKVAKKTEEPVLTVWWGHFRQYLREVLFELRKVVWPSRKETLGTTAVVLVIVVICGVFLGVVDLVLSRFIRLFVG